MLATKIYYLFSKEFNNEMYSVMVGKNKHIKDISSNNNSYFLRRSIHRIEKGLIMKNRKEVFGLDYIYDTVQNYSALLSKNQLSEVEHQWCYDVLNNYFKTSGQNRVVEESLKVFKEANQSYTKFNSRNNSSVPYIRIKMEEKNIGTIDELLNLSYYRRSVRWYQQRPVEKNKIENAIKVAAQSPSACNRQPFHYKIFLNNPMRNKILNCAMGTKGYADNVPGVAVVVGELEAYFDERDRHLIYIDSSLATMSLVYGLEVQGVSSCIINWPDIPERERKLKSLLNLPDNQRVIMLVAFGYADENEKVAYSAKKTTKELAIFDDHNFETSIQ
ncbi:nitroreductase family protein [Desertibacillus haloalkaliphilus]|nr:nitroreductase family protein [Desertibacillus haloalkaliphilus]